MRCIGILSALLLASWRVLHHPIPCFLLNLSRPHKVVTIAAERMIFHARGFGKSVFRAFGAMPGGGVVHWLLPALCRSGFFNINAGQTRFTIHSEYESPTDVLQRDTLRCSLANECRDSCFDIFNASVILHGGGVAHWFLLAFPAFCVVVQALLFIR